MPQPELTPKQQALMNYLSQIATMPMTPERLAEGNALLDAAADECRQEQAKLQSSTQEES
ncbi:MAG TPA: hypothetical protein V6D33_09715 [Cyanophyceae cyanobacterium]